MTKAETRELNTIWTHGKHLGADYMSRALSALHRSSRSNATKAEIETIADSLGLLQNSEFVIR
jgi:hypothetical protein